MSRAWFRTFRLAVVVAAAAGLLVQPAAAHGGEPLEVHGFWWAWEFTPPIVVALLALGLCYGLAVSNLWRSAGTGRLVAPWRVAVFYGGVATLALALLSPLDALSGALFSAHMVQHVLLMMVAAPLLALGAPAYTWLWAFPLTMRRSVAHWWLGHRQWTRLTRWVQLPLSTWVLSTVVLWLWHVPHLYEAALANEFVHALEHTSFLLTAWLFWGVVFELSRRSRKGDGVAILLVFTAAIQSGILGALITFARVPWYPSYESTTAAWGLTPLADQQLAGVSMWVPAGAAYLAAALVILGLRLASLERQAVQRPLEP